MKNKLFLAIGLLAASFCSGQTALTSTTLSAAISVNQTVFAVASVTGIACSTTNLTPLYILDPGNVTGELVNCQAVSGTTLTVQRGAAFRAAHVTGAIVVISNANNKAQSFVLSDPFGACTTANTLYAPRINTNNGRQWLCSTLTLAWVPGFNNPNPAQTTAVVASAAGAILPSGPLFHVSGTAAVTGFTLPVGFTSGGFCIVPDGNFTWTTAGNIGLAGTAVTGRVLCFTYDWAAGKFYPSYV